VPRSRRYRDFVLGIDPESCRKPGVGPEQAPKKRVAAELTVGDRQAER
jgi:hypothetical protein